MLRHPSKRYIHYLFSKRAYNLATVVDHLGSLLLPVPSDAKVLEQFVIDLGLERARMRVPANYDPTSRPMGDATRRFLEDWRIYDMWSGDPFVGRAVDCLFEPHIRRMMEVLLLGPFTMRSIARILQNRFDLTQEVMNPRVVAAYAHYFWDYDALSTPDWHGFTHGWIRGDITDYRVALLAPRNASGVATTLAVIDRGGEELNPVARYSTARDYGFKMFMEHALLQQPTLGRTQAAMFALQIMIQSEAELDKRRGGSAELLEELKKLEVVHDTSEIKTIHDLPVVKHHALPESTTPPVENVP